MLRGTRFEIVAMASDGEEALAAVARHDPTVCIFDVRMPKRSGVVRMVDARTRASTAPDRVISGP